MGRPIPQSSFVAFFHPNPDHNTCVRFKARVDRRAITIDRWQAAARGVGTGSIDLGGRPFLVCVCVCVFACFEVEVKVRLQKQNMHASTRHECSSDPPRPSQIGGGMPLDPWRAIWSIDRSLECLFICLCLSPVLHPTRTRTHARIDRSSPKPPAPPQSPQPPSTKRLQLIHFRSTDPRR
jgi:hypothetical protein